MRKLLTMKFTAHLRQQTLGNVGYKFVAGEDGDAFFAGSYAWAMQELRSGVLVLVTVHHESGMDWILEEATAHQCDKHDFVDSIAAKGLQLCQHCFTSYHLEQGTPLPAYFS